MILNLHPDIRIEKLTIGRERAPLIVVDNFLADPDRLVRRVASRPFTQHASYYPGIRTEAPLAYRARLGFVPDEPAFYEFLTGRQFLSLVASLRRQRSLRAATPPSPPAPRAGQILPFPCEPFSRLSPGSALCRALRRCAKEWK